MTPAEELRREAATCEGTVALELPCGLRPGHAGACQPDPEQQVRLYGLTLSDVRALARDLQEARRMGLDVDTGPGARPTALALYVRLRSELRGILDSEPPLAVGLEVARLLEREEARGR